MEGKRTKQIAVRITPETKKILEEEAKRLEWSTAKLAEKILREWTLNAQISGRGVLEFIDIWDKGIDVREIRKEEDK